MIDPGVAQPAARLLREVLGAVCSCAVRPWKVDVSRNIAGVTVRAEIRSR